MQTNCILSAPTLIPIRSLLSMLSVFMCKETEYFKQTIQAYEGIDIFFNKMWIVLKTDG